MMYLSSPSVRGHSFDSLCCSSTAACVDFVVHNQRDPTRSSGSMYEERRACFTKAEKNERDIVTVRKICQLFNDLSESNRFNVASRSGERARANVQYVDGRNPPLSKTLMAFESIDEPKIPVWDFVAMFTMESCCSPESLICAAILLDRFVDECAGKAVVSPMTAHRLILTAVVVAIKLVDDQLYCNRKLAKAGGVVPDDLCSMERTFVHLLNWDLFINRDGYVNFISSVLAPLPLRYRPSSEYLNALPFRKFERPRSVAPSRVAVAPLVALNHPMLSIGDAVGNSSSRGPPAAVAVPVQVQAPVLMSVPAYAPHLLVSNITTTNDSGSRARVQPVPTNIPNTRLRDYQSTGVAFIQLGSSSVQPACEIPQGGESMFREERSGAPMIAPTQAFTRLASTREIRERSGPHSSQDGNVYQQGLQKKERLFI